MPVDVSGKNVLIISGGVEALPIIKRAREMGLRVVVSDGDSEAPGFALAHEAIVASTYDIKETLRLTRISNKKTPLHGVISAAADVPSTVAALAEAFSLPGPSRRSACLASDKFLMKEAFREAGVPVPWFALIESAKHLKDLVKKSQKTLVIKPVDSRGARGVVRLSDGVDLLWAYGEALKNSPSSRVMVEQWVEGMQLSTESVVSDGRVATPGLSERNYEYLERFTPYIIENGGDLPAPCEPNVRELLDEVILRVARAFGIDNWTIKGDIVLSDKGPVVIEAAPRLSGGYFCTHTVPLSSGVDLVEAALLLALGVRIEADDYKPDFKRNVSQRFWFPEPGVVEDIRYSLDFDLLPGVEMKRLHVKRGDTIAPVVSHPCRAGMVITTGITREEAAARAREAISGVNIITEALMRKAL